MGNPVSSYRSALACLTVLLFLVPACAALAMDYTHRPTGIVLPEKLSMFTRGKPRDYDLNFPGMGTGISYELADIKAIIDIYDLNRRGSDITQEDVALEARRTVLDVYRKVEDRYYGEVVPLQDVALYDGGSLRPVFMAGYTVHNTSQSFREYIYMTSFKRHFIRIRMVHPDSTSDDIVRNVFVRRFIELLDRQGG